MEFDKNIEKVICVTGESNARSYEFFKGLEKKVEGLGDVGIKVDWKNVYHPKEIRGFVEFYLGLNEIPELYLAQVNHFSDEFKKEISNGNNFVDDISVLSSYIDLPLNEVIEVYGRGDMKDVLVGSKISSDVPNYMIFNWKGDIEGGVLIRKEESFSGFRRLSEFSNYMAKTLLYPSLELQVSRCLSLIDGVEKEYA